MNFHEFNCSHEAKITYNAINLFKHQFLMHPDDVLCKMSFVQYLYSIFNCKNI
jgi:hypothetical protein